MYAVPSYCRPCIGSAWRRPNPLQKTSFHLVAFHSFRVPSPSRFRFTRNSFVRRGFKSQLSNLLLLVSKKFLNVFCDCRRRPFAQLFIKSLCASLSAGESSTFGRFSAIDSFVHIVNAAPRTYLAECPPSTDLSVRLKADISSTAKKVEPSAGLHGQHDACMHAVRGMLRKNSVEVTNGETDRLPHTRVMPSLRRLGRTFIDEAALCADRRGSRGKTEGVSPELQPGAYLPMLCAVIVDIEMCCFVFRRMGKCVSFLSKRILSRKYTITPLVLPRPPLPSPSTKTNLRTVTMMKRKDATSKRHGASNRSSIAGER